jgi:hypothetical protein
MTQNIETRNIETRNIVTRNIETGTADPRLSTATRWPGCGT